MHNWNILIKPNRQFLKMIDKIKKTNKMKTNKLFYTLALIFMTSISFGQTQFDKYEDMEGVTSVIVNQKAFSLMGKIGTESDQEYLDLIKNIETLKVFATESPAVANQMAIEVDKYLKTSKLEELMRVKDGNDRVNIYVREGKTDNYVNELFMFVKSSDESVSETVIICLTGNIDLKQVSKLTKEMDLPGGKHLEKAGKQ